MLQNRVSAIDKGLIGRRGADKERARDRERAKFRNRVAKVAGSRVREEGASGMLVAQTR
jgi:hypothetical protein